jgi:hypothetical protein
MLPILQILFYNILLVCNRFQVWKWFFLFKRTSIHTFYLQFWGSSWHSVVQRESSFARQMRRLTCKHRIRCRYLFGILLHWNVKIIEFIFKIHMQLSPMLKINIFGLEINEHTHTPLTFYHRKGSRGISDIPPRRPRFKKITYLWRILQTW